MFGCFGGSLKVGGEWVQHPRCVLVVPDAVDRAELLGQQRSFVPAYLGASGWVGVDLPPLRATRGRWDEVAELLDASYRQTAPARLVRRLDDLEPRA